MIRFVIAMVAVMALALFANAQGHGEKKKQEKKQSDDAVVVMPGETKSLNGVTVENTGSAGKVKLTPTGQNGVTVSCDSGAEFSLDGLQTGDVVNLQSGSIATVQGTGGTINTASACQLTMTCVGGPPNALLANLPTGGTVIVGGGSTATINT